MLLIWCTKKEQEKSNTYKVDISIEGRLSPILRNFDETLELFDIYTFLQFTIIV